MDKSFDNDIKIFRLTSIFPILILCLIGKIMPQDFQFEQSLYSRYEFYKEQSIQTRLIKHRNVEVLLKKHSQNKLFNISKVGESVEGRSLNLIKIGEGKIKIFLWSQMHGDEPTATEAIFDILNFLSANDDYNELREYLFRKLSIYFLPMVNPDGAERFQRRNALAIDLNRDARNLESPESKILKNVFDSLKADFGFNLHDQSKYYSVGRSGCPAAISFLAPPIDEIKTNPPNRAAAMKLISELYLIANSFIPGHIARYSDEYEPRAFGDNFQQLGTSIILIESGGWCGDSERQFIRKINFILLLSAFKSIADHSFKSRDISTYESIPFNNENSSDFIFRNVTLRFNGKFYKTDLAIRSEDKLYDGKITTKSFISDIGDLSLLPAYNDFDLNGYEFRLGKEITFSETLPEPLDYINLLSQGITSVIFTNGVRDQVLQKRYPLRFLSEADASRGEFKLQSTAEFVLLKDNIIRFAFVNGNLFDLRNDFWLTK